MKHLCSKIYFCTVRICTAMKIDNDKVKLFVLSQRFLLLIASWYRSSLLLKSAILTSLNVAIQKVFVAKFLSVMICALQTFSSREPTQIRWLMVWRTSYFCVATKWSSLRFKQRYAGLTEVKRSTARTGNLWSAPLIWKDTSAHKNTSFIFFQNDVFMSLISIILSRTVNWHHVQKKKKKSLNFIILSIPGLYGCFLVSWTCRTQINYMNILWNFK